MSERDRKYNASEKGKARSRRYTSSQKRHDAQARYDQTDAGRARKQRYEEKRACGTGLKYLERLLATRRRAALKRISNRRAEP